MTHHDHPTERLAGYVLGDLERPEQEELEVHLLSCGPCRDEVAALRDALLTLSGTLPHVPVPAGAWQGVEAKRAHQAAQDSARAHQAAQDSIREETLPAPALLTPRKRMPMLWPVAAAVAFGLLLGGMGMQSHLGRQQQATLQNPVATGAQPLKLVNAAGETFGTVLLLKDMQAVVFLDKRPPAGMVYQVWGRRKAQRQGGEVKAVSLGMTEGTQLSVIRCNSYEFVGVSLEPSGGNVTPTKPLGRAKIPTKRT